MIWSTNHAFYQTYPPLLTHTPPTITSEYRVTFTFILYWLHYSIDATARVLQYVITFHKIYLQDIKQIGIAPCNLYTCTKLLHHVQPYVYTYTINFAKYFYCTSCYCALRYVWHHIAWSLYLWNCLCCVFLEIWDWVKVYCVIDVV